MRVRVPEWNSVSFRFSHPKIKKAPHPGWGGQCQELNTVDNVLSNQFTSDSERAACFEKEDDVNKSWACMSACAIRGAMWKRSFQSLSSPFNTSFGLAAEGLQNLHVENCTQIHLGAHLPVKLKIPRVWTQKNQRCCTQMCISELVTKHRL